MTLYLAYNPNSISISTISSEWLYIWHIIWTLPLYLAYYLDSIFGIWAEWYVYILHIIRMTLYLAYNPNSISISGISSAWLYIWHIIRTLPLYLAYYPDSIFGIWADRYLFIFGIQSEWLYIWHIIRPLFLYLAHYGVATISRLLKIIGLFCRIQSLL